MQEFIKNYWLRNNSIDNSKQNINDSMNIVKSLEKPALIIKNF